MSKRVVVLHGCCKGDTDPNDILMEGRAAAALLGVQDAIVPYYTCALNAHSISVGHDIPIHSSCSTPGMHTALGDHDDSVWEDELLKLVAALDDPREELVTGMDLAVRAEVAGTSPVALPQFWLPWFVRSWTDVHVFLNHPGGKEVVWNEIESHFAGIGEYVLVAHSLGTLIAAHLIGNDLIQPSALVTVGSQLGWATIRNLNLLPVFAVDFPWVNVIDHEDVSSGFFSGDLTPVDNGYGGSPYADVWVSNPAGGNHHDLVGYMSTAEAQKAIMPLIAD